MNRMMTRMERQMRESSVYRVYGHLENGNIFDEYCEAYTAQHAVDQVREWFDADGGVVEEVAKVVKGWR